jgi:plasmid stabilization system protein ParE
MPVSPLRSKNWRVASDPAALPMFRADISKYAVGSHLVFYRETGHDIVIVRILHQRMDVERHLE